MCGRFSLATSKEKLQQQLPFVEVPEELGLSYNIAPTQHAYVVTDNEPDLLQFMTWGLVPYWSEDGKNTGRLINARKEGLEEKPSFRMPIRKRRCLVPADSFYEWRKFGRVKIPYRILLDNGRLMFFAGLWDVWQRGGTALKTFSIITTHANEDMSDLHDRMPVLLITQEQQKRWLESSDLEEVLSLLQTAPVNTVHKYRVTEKLNSVSNNSPEMHLEIPEQPTLFG